MPTQPNVNPALSSLLVPLAKLVEDKQNARRHDKRSVDAIAASLKRFGQQKPIVVLEDGTVIAGNGSLRAAKSLKWESIAAVRFPDEESARAYAIADNRTSDLSTWDDAALAAGLEAVNAASAELLAATGFSFDEVMELVGKQTDAVTVDGKGAVPDDGGEFTRPTTQQLIGQQSHIRSVQLFLTEDDHDAFMAKVRALSGVLKTDNITDTIRAIVDELHAAKGLPAVEGKKK